MKKIVVAIDGVSGAGKSTIANLVAKKLKIKYFSSGTVFRSLAKFIIDNKIDPQNEEAVVNALTTEFKFNQKEAEKNEVALHAAEISQIVSKVSSYPEVGKLAHKILQDIAKKQAVVMDGRDVGTYIAPNAKYKFYINCDIKVRAERLFEERLRNGVEKTNLYSVTEEIKNRDKLDTEREYSPLRRADTALLIDVSDSTSEEAAQRIYQLITKKPKVGLFYRFFKFLLWMPMRILFPCKVVGKENLVKHGSVIFAPNHQSNVDSILLFSYIPRRQYTVGKIELAKKPLLNFLAKGVKWILVDRENPSREFFKRTSAVLKNGDALVLFPEGTRGKGQTDVENMQTKGGLALFGLKSGAPIQVISILKKAKPFKKNIIYISPFFYLDKTTRVTKEDIEKASVLVQNKMIEGYTHVSEIKAEEKLKKITTKK